MSVTRVNGYRTGRECFQLSDFRGRGLEPSVSVQYYCYYITAFTLRCFSENRAGKLCPITNFYEFREFPLVEVARVYRKYVFLYSLYLPFRNTFTNDAPGFLIVWPNVFKQKKKPTPNFDEIYAKHLQVGFFFLILDFHTGYGWRSDIYFFWFCLFCDTIDGDTKHEQRVVAIHFFLGLFKRISVISLYLFSYKSVG